MNKNDISINLEFGDDSDQKKLVDCDFEMMVGKQAAEKLGFVKQDNNDVHLQIKFHVVPGREKETVEYLERAMDQPEEHQREQFTPLQQMLIRPKSSGNVHFEERPGMVLVIYTFYEEYTVNDMNQEVAEIVDAINESKFQPNIKLNLVVRGSESEKIKEKTSILPNYVALNFMLQNYDPEQLFKVLVQKQILEKQFLENPILNLIGLGLKKVKLNFQFNSLRKILKQYKQAAKIKQIYRPDKYLNKNLLTDKIEIVLICRKFGAVKAQVNFISESHIQRILKIFTKMATYNF